MGHGVDLARDSAPAHAKMLDDLKDQLLIVFLKRLGGKVSIPVTEVDNTDQDLLLFNVENKIFNFEIRKKH